MPLPSHVAREAPGKTVELITKHQKVETNDHVVMWVGVKTDKETGEMKGQIRGVRNDTIFKKILNFLKGRRVATHGEVAMHCMNRGMSLKEANQALDNVTLPRGEGYSVKSFNEQLQAFDDNKRAAVQKSGKPSDPNMEITVKLFNIGNKPSCDP